MEKRHISPQQAPRVRLRLLEEHDLPRTLAWRNQDHVRRWFFFSERLTPEQHAAWFARYRQSDDDFVFIIEEQSSRHTPCAIGPAAPTAGSCQASGALGGPHASLASGPAVPGVILRQDPGACGGRRTPAACDGRPIGQAAIYNVDWLKGTAEFGRLMIGEADAAGRGLAQEATEALLALAFELGLQEVHLEVLAGNERAIKLYEACGFQVASRTEKTLRMSKRAVLKSV